MEINKTGKFDPGVSKTPEPMVTKYGMGDEVGDIYPYAKFYYDPIRGFCSLPHPVSARWWGAYKVTQLVFSSSSSPHGIFKSGLSSNATTRTIRFWFFCQPTAKTSAPIFTISTSNDVVSRKDVPFGGSENILHFDPIFPQKPKFSANFWRKRTCQPVLR